MPLVFYLTTTPRAGGEPDTGWYVGTRPPDRQAGPGGDPEGD